MNLDRLLQCISEVMYKSQGDIVMIGLISHLCVAISGFNHVFHSMFNTSDTGGVHCHICTTTEKA